MSEPFILHSIPAPPPSKVIRAIEAAERANPNIKINVVSEDSRYAVVVNMVESRRARRSSRFNEREEA